MTEPRVLVLGDSCIRRLLHFLSRVPNVLALILSYLRAFMEWHGVSGRTGSTTLELDLNVIESFHPDVVIMQLGSNDLIDSDPLHVGWAIDDFARLLHDTFGVKVVCVYQTIMHQSAVVINHKA